MEPNPLFLCIETSSPVCSVALGTATGVVDEKTSEEPNGHSRMLTLMVEEITRQNQISLQQIDGVTVNTGPGSYTGLRIGMSTAKGLCYALEKPLIGITAFESMVAAFLKTHTPHPSDLIIPMIDARRMEVYTRVFNAQGIPVGEQMAYISGNDGLFSSEPQGKLWLIGSGAEKMQADLSKYDVTAIGSPFLSAAGLLTPAIERFRAGKFDDVAYSTPNYGKAWQKG